MSALFAEVATAIFEFYVFILFQQMSQQLQFIFYILYIFDVDNYFLKRVKCVNWPAVFTNIDVYHFRDCIDDKPCRILLCLVLIRVGSSVFLILQAKIKSCGCLLAQASRIWLKSMSNLLTYYICPDNFFQESNIRVSEFKKGCTKSYPDTPLPPFFM